MNSVFGVRFSGIGMVLALRCGLPTTDSRQPIPELAATAVAGLYRRTQRMGPASAGQRARSSAGEHHVDIVGVTGSIPVAPTTQSLDMAGYRCSLQKLPTFPRVMAPRRVEVRDRETIAAPCVGDFGLSLSGSILNHLQKCQRGVRATARSSPCSGELRKQRPLFGEGEGQ